MDLAGQWRIYLQKYQDLARELNINIVPGTIVQRMQVGDNQDQLINVVYFIDNRGEILGSYQKKNLWYTCTYIHMLWHNTPRQSLKLCVMI